MGGVLFSAEDKKANEKEEHKENAEGGSEGLVACAGKLVLDDFADCRVGTAQFNLKATARGKKIEGVYLASFTLIQTAQGLSIVSFQATPLKPTTP